MIKGLLFATVAVFISACSPTKEYYVVRDQTPVQQTQEQPKTQPVSGTLPYTLQQPYQNYIPYQGQATTYMPQLQAPQNNVYVPQEPAAFYTTQAQVVEQPSYVWSGTYVQEITPTVYSVQPQIFNVVQPEYQGTELAKEAPQIKAVPVAEEPKTVTENPSEINPLLTIVLQHPENRDLVKCSAADTACLSDYEQKGYVRLRNTPRFAGHKEPLTDSDYPRRQWQNNHNIPRW